MREDRGLLWIGEGTIALGLYGFLPDRYDLPGAGICLVGASIIMYAPRAGALET